MRIANKNYQPDPAEKNDSNQMNDTLKRQFNKTFSVIEEESSTKKLN